MKSDAGNRRPSWPADEFFDIYARNLRRNIEDSIARLYPVHPDNWETDERGSGLGRDIEWANRVRQSEIRQRGRFLLQDLYLDIDELCQLIVRARWLTSWHKTDDADYLTHLTSSNSVEPNSHISRRPEVSE